MAGSRGAVRLSSALLAAKHAPHRCRAWCQMRLTQPSADAKGIVEKSTVLSIYLWCPSGFRDEFIFQMMFPCVQRSERNPWI